MRQFLICMGLLCVAAFVGCGADTSVIENENPEPAPTEEMTEENNTATAPPPEK